MLMVDLIIILFLLKLDKFCCIWGYELVENDLLWFCFYFWQILCQNFFLTKYFFVPIKMCYYFFNWQELLEKAKDRHYNCGGKEKTAEYFIGNKEV